MALALKESEWRGDRAITALGAHRDIASLLYQKEEVSAHIEKDSSALGSKGEGRRTQDV